MRLLLDESVDFPLAAHLQAQGHDVKAIAHDFPQALKDREVLAIAHDEQRILLTNDKDFGELVFREQLPHAGVILFRLGNEDLAVKSQRLDEVLRDHATRLARNRCASARLMDHGQRAPLADWASRRCAPTLAQPT